MTSSQTRWIAFRLLGERHHALAAALYRLPKRKLDHMEENLRGSRFVAGVDHVVSLIDQHTKDCHCGDDFAAAIDVAIKEAQK